MNVLSRRTAQALGVAALVAGASFTSAAADMVLTPAPASAVVLQSAGGSDALRVLPSGAIQLPGVPATPASGTAAVCHDAQGTLVRCDPAALAGTQGPAGPAGPQGVAGPAGPAGATGPRGNAWLVKASAEAAGGNCATGGQRLDFGMDANANNTLDAGEISGTSYVCNGVQGLQGVQGPKGDPGTGGVTGLTEARHGCFDGSGTVLSGTGFTIAAAGSAYTATFSPAPGAGTYSLFLDGRTSTGRALALTASGTPAAGITMTAGWLDAGGETVQRICFMLAR